MIKFTSIDKENRTATFEVDGEMVTRRIPNRFAGTIDDYLNALASGLQVEVDEKAAKVPQEIEEPVLQAGEVVIPALTE